MSCVTRSHTPTWEPITLTNWIQQRTASCNKIRPIVPELIIRKLSPDLGLRRCMPGTAQETGSIRSHIDSHGSDVGRSGGDLRAPGRVQNPPLLFQAGTREALDDLALEEEERDQRGQATEHRRRHDLGVVNTVGGLHYAQIMATAVLGGLPTLIAFLFFQRQIIQGFAGTGLKEERWVLHPSGRSEVASRAPNIRTVTVHM